MEMKALWNGVSDCDAKKCFWMNPIQVFIFSLPFRRANVLWLFALSNEYPTLLGCFEPSVLSLFQILFQLQPAIFSLIISL